MVGDSNTDVRLRYLLPGDYDWVASLSDNYDRQALLKFTMDTKNFGFILDIDGSSFGYVLVERKKDIIRIEEIVARKHPDFVYARMIVKDLQRIFEKRRIDMLVPEDRSVKEMEFWTDLGFVSTGVVRTVDEDAIDYYGFKWEAGGFRPRNRISKYL